MQINIEENQKEIKEHGSYSFPLNVAVEHIESYEQGAFLWHWHPEIEITKIVSGEMEYHINEKIYNLEEGEGMFGNSRTLHAGYRRDRKECTYLSITFHPRLLYGYTSSLMQSKYMERILQSPTLSSIHFTPDVFWQREILERMEEIHHLRDKGPDSRELQMQIALMEIWLRIYEHTDCPEEPEENSRDIERIRTLMEYMQKHYGEKVTLEELADQIHLCKSESCRLFKRYMKESLFDYLLAYRVERSLELLRHTDLDVTGIAGNCGFTNPGYYARIFRRKMGCTPLQYRKNRRES